MNELKFPPLGTESKTFPATLTEPQINAIHAAVGFLRAEMAELEKASGMEVSWWQHYGPTLERLSEDLGVFDD
jgi:hypothetical protein